MKIKVFCSSFVRIDLKLIYLGAESVVNLLLLTCPMARWVHLCLPSCGPGFCSHLNTTSMHYCLTYELSLTVYKSGHINLFNLPWKHSLSYLCVTTKHAEAPIGTWFKCQLGVARYLTQTS